VPEGVQVGMLTIEMEMEMEMEMERTHQFSAGRAFSFPQFPFSVQLDVSRILTTLFNGGKLSVD